MWAAKDRVYLELKCVIEFLDTITVCACERAPVWFSWNVRILIQHQNGSQHQNAFHLTVAEQAEPFASMNEFEKLKCAGICCLEIYQHGEVILDGAENEGKLFMELSGNHNVNCFVVNESASQLPSLKAIKNGKSSVIINVQALFLFSTSRRRCHSSTLRWWCQEQSCVTWWKQWIQRSFISNSGPRVWSGLIGSLLIFLFERINRRGKRQSKIFRSKQKERYPRFQLRVTEAHA